MNKVFFFVACITSWLSATAQQQHICTQQFNNLPAVTGEPANSFASVNEAKTIVAKIIKTIGLKPNFEMKEANVGNAAAVVYGNKRYILYNSTFIKQLNSAAGNDWAAISVLAHEIGHHLNGHTLDNLGSQPAKELEADEFSGFVMQQMGATLQQAQLAMQIAADAKGSATHPGKQQRLAAIARGYSQAGSNTADVETAIATNKPPVQPRTKTEIIRIPSSSATQTAIAEKYIAGDVHFVHDNRAKYFVTVKSHIVKVINNQLLIVGTLAAHSDKQYPYVIYDQRKTKLLVDKTGSIYNSKGAKIGWIATHTAS